MRDEAMETQFAAFKAGLAVGAAGLFVTVIGAVAGAYWAILTGSIATSLGLVTVACALVSAETASRP